MYKLHLTLVLLLLFISTSLAQYVPVGSVIDVPLVGQNTVISVAEGVMNFLLKEENELQDNIKDVQQFFQKAETKVNGAVKNMRMVKEIVEIQKDILELYKKALSRLNQPIDEDGDGVDDLEFLQKWKHIEVLLAFTKETASVFELFVTLIEDDSMTMNDKGRIVFLEKAYKDMLLIKRAMRTHLRRINREIYTYSSKKKQLQVYRNLFRSD